MTTGDEGAEGGDGGKYDWIIGIVLMFVGAICTNLGNNLMSLGHLQQREIDVNEKIKSGCTTPVTSPQQTRRKKSSPTITPVDAKESSNSESPALIRGNSTTIPPSDDIESAVKKPFKAVRRPSYGEAPDKWDKSGLHTGIERIINTNLPNRPSSATNRPTRGKDGTEASLRRITIGTEFTFEKIPSLNFSTSPISKKEIATTSPKESVKIEEEAEQEAESKEEKPKETWWLAGAVIFVFGALVVFLSFGFAAQSLLAALESVQFVSNVFFAKYIHGEMITRRIICSTVSIVLGNILVVIFSSHASNRLDAQEVAIIFMTNTGFHIYLAVSGLLFFFSLWMCRFYHYARTELNITYWNHSFLEPMAFIVYMSLIGTQAVLHSKNLSMLMQHCIQGVNQFATPYKAIVWMELFIWILAAYLYCGCINTGLELYPPVFFIPVQAVCFAFFTIICGGIFFDEFQFDVPQAVCFSIGISLIFAGVYALAPQDVHLAKVCPVDAPSDLSDNVPSDVSNKYAPTPPIDDGTLQTLEVDDLESCDSMTILDDKRLLSKIDEMNLNVKTKSTQ